jgi:hypothetical protein
VAGSRSGLAAVILAAVLWPGVPEVSAGEPPTRDPEPLSLWQDSLEAQRLTDSSSDMVLDTYSASGENMSLRAILTAKLESDGVGRMLLLRIATTGPLDGSAFLTIEHMHAAHDLWVFLPAVGVPRRLVASNLGDSFLGTEFRLGDLVQPDPDDYTVTAQATDAIDGDACWIVEAVPRTVQLERATGIGREVFWLRKENLMPRRIEQYDRRKALLKRHDVGQWQALDGGKKWFALERTIRNVQTGAYTHAVFSNLRVGIGISTALFAPQHLTERSP